MSIFLTVIVTILYILLGVGTAFAEMKCREVRDDLDLITLIFWPLALIVWAITGNI